jgi:nifR3 family TIM-barrel protein
MAASGESAQAQQTHAAAAGEFSPMRLGDLSIWPPVILAPMAGVTNSTFRHICRQHGAGLCVSEMIAARPLVDDNSKTWSLAAFGPEERPRSIQLYGVDPDYVGRAIERLGADAWVDHVDLNFGCSVPKVTRQGGGAALPQRPKLLAAILGRAVRAAGRIPVTVKFRMGLTEDHLNYITTGLIAQDCGCAAVTLHARTAAQFYDGDAHWDAIAELKSRLGIPVVGNGDIWEAADALRMMRTTGCDAVAIGRGCLGRPWLFEDLARMFSGERPNEPPRLGAVVDAMLKHLALLVEAIGETRAIPSFRRQATWYTKGFRGSTHLRDALVSASSQDEIASVLAQVDRALEYPTSVLRVPRGKSSGQKRLSLPDGYLEDPESAELPADGAWADGG